MRNGRGGGVYVGVGGDSTITDSIIANVSAHLHMIGRVEAEGAFR
jgi:hypothetical protein